MKKIDKYTASTIARYAKEFKVNHELTYIGKNGSEYVINTFKLYGDYFYRIKRFNDLFKTWEYIQEARVGKDKKYLMMCVSRQIEFLGGY